VQVGPSGQIGRQVPYSSDLAYLLRLGGERRSEEAATDHRNEPSALHHWVFPQRVCESGARGCGVWGNRAGSMQEPSLEAGRESSRGCQAAHGPCPLSARLLLPDGIKIVETREHGSARIAWPLASWSASRFGLRAVGASDAAGGATCPKLALFSGRGSSFTRPISKDTCGQEVSLEPMSEGMLAGRREKNLCPALGQGSWLGARLSLLTRGGAWKLVLMRVEGRQGQHRERGRAAGDMKKAGGPNESDPGPARSLQSCRSHARHPG
jgi:hypothetical protein